MIQMDLFDPAKPAAKSKKKPPVLKRDVMGVCIPVMWAYARMKAGIGRGEWQVAERYADEIEQAIDEYEAIAKERDLPDGFAGEYREWSAPIREAVDVLRDGAAKLSIDNPPLVTFNRGNFLESTWDAETRARREALEQLRPRFKGPAPDCYAALAEHFRLLLPDADDPKQCQARIDFHLNQVRVYARGVRDRARKAL